MFKSLISCQGYFANIVQSKLPQLTVLAVVIYIQLTYLSTGYFQIIMDRSEVKKINIAYLSIGFKPNLICLFALLDYNFRKIRSF